jgi:hypothetical protein
MGLGLKQDSEAASGGERLHSWSGAFLGHMWMVMACWRVFKSCGVGCVADLSAANTRRQHDGSRRRGLGACRVARKFFSAQVEEVEVEVLAEVGNVWPLNVVRDVATAQCR